jgi:hypothetical protein
MPAPMSRPYLRRSDTSSAGEFRLDFFVPLPPRCPYKSPAVQNAHTTHAHTKNNETIFYCTCNEGRGGTRGTNANCAKWTTHTSASHPATEPTGRHFGANAASFRDLCTNETDIHSPPSSYSFQEGSKNVPSVSSPPQKIRSLLGVKLRLSVFHQMFFEPEAPAGPFFPHLAFNCNIFSLLMIYSHTIIFARQGGAHETYFGLPETMGEGAALELAGALLLRPQRPSVSGC